MNTSFENYVRSYQPDNMDEDWFDEDGYYQEEYVEHYQDPRIEDDDWYGKNNYED